MHVFSTAVEGFTDEVVLSRLIAHVGASVARTYGRKGKQHLLKRLAGYNVAAQFSPWIVLVDLDCNTDCAPTFRTLHLPTPAALMRFTIAVQAVEAWLLADRERLADFLSVPVAAIPEHPDEEPDPKRTMVEVARQSRRREVRDDMVPRPSSGRMVGPAYASRLQQFVVDTVAGWRPDVAAKHSPSLRRCLNRLQRPLPRDVP